ncbi:MAG: class I SAM-dependent methyltransferase [Thermoleophilia bacterium]|nr:class I SAM-dependent methyltransferase [Thermoleophilia bacterium]
MPSPLNNPADSFDRSAVAYDLLVAPNRAGSRRLIAALPEEEFPNLLDVGCGTGFAALEAIERRGVRHLVGVDTSQGMLDVLRERLGAHPDVRADLRARDVLDMGVDDGWADLVLSTMALHWFTDRPAAIAAMGRALRPGGVLGILAPGERHDSPTVDVIRATGDRHLGRLADSIVNNEIPVEMITAMVEAAGLEPIDIWSETRHRVVAAGTLADRMEAVATHLWSDLPDDEQHDLLRRMREVFTAAADADGMYRYRFVKTFAVARRSPVA